MIFEEIVKRHSVRTYSQKTVEDEKIREIIEAGRLAPSAYNYQPWILHRIASVSSGGLDTLPHNGAVLTLLAVTGLTHKDSYKDIFVVSVVIPVITGLILVLFSTVGLNF